jgi:ABC-type sugar transport system permease subunit
MPDISLIRRETVGTSNNLIVWRRRLFPFFLLLPALLLFAVFTLYPIINGFFFSFMEWDGFSDGKWTGLSNYTKAINDPFVWEALTHNVYYAFFTVVGKVVFGLLLAILLNQKLKGISVYRTIIFIPVVLSFVAVGLLWSWIYNPVFGLLNNFLGLFGFPSNTAWLGDPKLALGALIVVDIWKWAGYHMVLFLAGLQNIPGDLYEAATVDGASRKQSFFHITLPLMVPIIIINTTIAIMGAFNVFDIVYVMTNAGPYHATEVVMTYSYSQAFKLHSFGYGAAISYLLLLIIAIVTAIQLFFMKRFSH